MTIWLRPSAERAPIAMLTLIVLALVAAALASGHAHAGPAPDRNVPLVAAREDSLAVTGDDSLAVTPVDPPEDTADGADAVTERGDSVAEGDVEVGLGADGSGDRIAHPRRRVRFRDGGLRGDLRSGDGDPLAGGALEASILGGALALGRVTPRWGRAMVLGVPADPWRAARDADLAPAPRGRSFEGARWRSARSLRVELAAGELAKERLAVIRIGHGVWDAGVLAREHGGPIGSISFAGADAALELGLDRRGVWRAEGVQSGGAGTLAWSLRARAGAEGYAPPGVVTGRVPARASAFELAGGGPFAWRLLAALWRFRTGVAGARGALEVTRRMAHHDDVALGFEQQQGARRDGSSPPGAMRQAAWVEWRAERGPVHVGLRDEVWGRRAFAREAVREVTTQRVAFDAGRDGGIAITRSAYRVASGESLYLPETGSDRLWLRAVSGAGTFTRLEASWRLAGGRLRTSLTRIENPGRSPRPHWSIDWTRRSGTARAPAGAGS
jgi:hypothetical protein